MGNFGAELKKMVTKPVSYLMEKEQNEELKVSAIKGVIVSAVIALAAVLIMVAVIETSFKSVLGSYSYLSGSDYVATAKASAYASANLFGVFCYSFIGAFLAMGVVGLAFFAIAKAMKSNKQFKNSFALGVNFCIYVGVAIILYSICSFINATLASAVLSFIILFADYATKFALRNSLSDVADDDKLTIWSTIIVTGISILAGFVLAGIFSSMIIGNSLAGMSNLNRIF